MSRQNQLWAVLMLLGGGFLLVRALTGEMGRGYVAEETVFITGEGEDVERDFVAGPPTEEEIEARPDAAYWTRYRIADPSNRGDEHVHFSASRTIGLWVAALLTLAIFSFLFGDSVFYRLAESIFVGVSAAYVMVVGFWTGIVQNLFGKLAPDLVQSTLMPGLKQEATEWSYLVPLVFGIMLLMRLSPTGGWISRWPLAFFIGATAGLRLIAFFEADFVRQIQATLIPLVVYAEDGSFDAATSLANLTIVVGTLSTLVYFFFSVEHEGVFGGVSRLGIWFLMITFGASFGYTVMGRIALFAQRLEFLFDDWLWIIDPLGRRVGL